MTIHWFFSTALNRRLVLHQQDVKTAFLHSNLPYTKFAFVPDRCQLDHSKYILHPCKAAYGLAISPLLWYNTIVEALEILGCFRTFREPCISHKHVARHLLLVIIYLYDIVLASSSVDISEDCICHLETLFQSKCIGLPET